MKPIKTTMKNGMSQDFVSRILFSTHFPGDACQCIINLPEQSNAKRISVQFWDISSTNITHYKIFVDSTNIMSKINIKT